MIFNPSAADDIEQRDPVFAAPPTSPPLLLSTYVAEEPLTLELNDDAASSSSSSSDNDEGIEDPNAMTVAQMINTIIEDGIVLPTEEEIAGRRSAAGLPAENADEEPGDELMGMMKEMVELTYNEEERAQLGEDILEELAAREEAEAEAAKEKRKGKGKEKEVVEEPEAAGPSTASRAADDSWQGLSRLLGGELLSDRDISTILSREVSPTLLTHLSHHLPHKHILYISPPTQTRNADPHSSPGSRRRRSRQALQHGRADDAVPRAQPCRSVRPPCNHSLT
jgi:hypothetical protein